MSTHRFLLAALTALTLTACGEKTEDSTVTTDSTPTYQAPVPAESRLIAGHYRYLADAAVFTGCHTGQRWPVASTAAAADLERAYLEARSAPGESLVVAIYGHIEVMAGMEAGTELPQLVVDRVEQVPAGIDCPVPNAELHGRKWQSESLAGDSLSGDNPPWLSFSEDGTLQGFAGCNRFTGSYSYNGTDMDVGPLAMTRMACRDGAEIEKNVVDALNRVSEADIEGDLLRLRHGGDTLMELRGVALP